MVFFKIPSWKSGSTQTGKGMHPVGGHARQDGESQDSGKAGAGRGRKHGGLQATARWRAGTSNRHGPGYRVYLSRQGAVLVLLLCGSSKCDPDREISKAVAYLNDWKEKGPAMSAPRDKSYADLIDRALPFLPRRRPIWML